MYVPKIGTLQNNSELIHVTWEIQRFFSSVVGPADVYVSSPTFQFANADWCILVYPNGVKADGSVGYIGIYLSRQYYLNNEIVPLSFSFDIGCEEKYSCFYLFGAGEKSGFAKFIETKELLRKRPELVTSDTLTVICRASIASHKKYIDGISSLSGDFENLFQNGQDWDATITVKGKVFHVHKLILASRSPVLSAMFTHDMKEKISGKVNIDDCEPDIFHDLLLYLYSGKTENLSPSNAVCLYYLADKYSLEDLKQICVDFLKYNLDIDNIFKVVTLANRHNEEKLRDAAFKWFGKNLKDVVKTDQWMNFMAENTTLAAELLKKTLG